MAEEIRQAADKQHWTYRRETEDFTVITTGQRVCIVGVGTASGVHVHHTVTKVTRTQIVSTRTTPGGKAVERRHYRDDGHSVGSRTETYGYTAISATCQRPRKEP